MALDCSAKLPRPNGRAGVGGMPLGRRLGLNYHVNYASSRRPSAPGAGWGFGMAGPEGKLLDGAALSLLGEARPGQLAGGGEAHGQRNKKY